MLICFWTCGFSISLSHLMCCRPDPCPPIKVICGFECNCNVKNKSAQQSTFCLVTGSFLCFSCFSLQQWGRCWQHLCNATGRGPNNKASSSESNSGHNSLIVARVTENKLNLGWHKCFISIFTFNCLPSSQLCRELQANSTQQQHKCGLIIHKLAYNNTLCFFYNPSLTM